MKMRSTVLVVLLALAGPLLARDDISPNDLPESVRSALYQLVGSEPVKEVVREVMDGRTTYRVEIDRKNAINPRLRFTETGELLTERATSAGLALDPTTPAPVTYGPAPSLEELPAAVRQTVRNEARGREVADIDRETRDARTVYEVQFQSKGINPRIHIDAEGALIDPDESPADPPTGRP